LKTKTSGVIKRQILSGPLDANIVRLENTTSLRTHLFRRTTVKVVNYQDSILELGSQGIKGSTIMNVKTAKTSLLKKNKILNEIK